MVFGFEFEEPFESSATFAVKRGFEILKAVIMRNVVFHLHL
jgi:hypothetical protein